jgi:hypothetical protein
VQNILNIFGLGQCKIFVRHKKIYGQTFPLTVFSTDITVVWVQPTSRADVDFTNGMDFGGGQNAGLCGAIARRR